MLKMEDEVEYLENFLNHFLQMMTISRGGTMMTLVKQTAFGVPPIVIGHNLDQVRKGRNRSFKQTNNTMMKPKP